MRELERILEEIEMKKKKCLDIVRVEIDPMEITIHREQYKGLRMAEDIIRKHMNDGWIPAEKELPEEHTCIDEETGYYGRSDDVLCSAYDDYTGEYETWIDYTMDGQWQTHEWYEGEPLAWQPLPRPYSPERRDNHDRE